MEFCDRRLRTMILTIFHINLLWAVVGIIDKDVHNSLQFMKRQDEPVEVTVGRYVIGYLGFWHIDFIDKEKMNRCNDEKVIELGRKKQGHCPKFCVNVNRIQL